MLTLTDCEDYCDLSPIAIRALSRHEQLPEIIAAEMADNLLHNPEGIEQLRRIFEDELETARDNEDAAESECLQQVLDDLINKTLVVANQRSNSM